MERRDDRCITARVSTSALVILAALLIAIPLPAQVKQRVRLDVLVGFNGLAREGRFAPLVLSIDNPGARISADVSVEVSWGSTFRGTQEKRTYTRTETLAAGSLRRLPFVVPIPLDARTLAVTVASEGATIAREQVDLRSVTTSDRLVAGISSTLSLDALAGLSDGGGSVRLAYPRLDDLPEAWAGYDGVDVVVVHDTYFRQLRESQVTALERWVVTGGTVVFTGGAAALQHVSAGLARLLPVEVTGLGERTDLPALGPFAGQRSGPRGRITIAESRVTSGIVLAAQDDVPLVVERSLGRGAIWFLAFDPTLPPFDGWSGTLGLWRVMAGRDRQPALDIVAREPADDPWMATMLAHPPLAFPSALALVIFAGAYIGLLAVVVADPRKRRFPMRLRAVLVLSIPVVASVLGWVLFNRVLFRPTPLLLEASTVEVRAGSPFAYVTEKVGLFASRPGDCAVLLDEADALIDEIAPPIAVTRRRESLGGGLTILAGETTGVDGIALGRFGSRLIVTSAVVPFPISAILTHDGASIGLSVVNASDRTLHDCFFWRNGRAYPVGDVAPLAAFSRRFTQDDGLAMQEAPAWSGMEGGASRGEFWNLVSGASDTGSGVLAGWLDGSALNLSVTGAVSTAERPPLSLVLVEAL